MGSTTNPTKVTTHMTNDRAQVRLRMGDLEIEYEGAASFLTSELVALVREVASLHVARTAPASEDEADPPKSAAKSQGLVDLSMTNVATRLNAKTGPELAIAAAAFLTISQGRELFTRRDILATMKAAPAHYKKSMSGNLSKSLQRLLKDQRLNETDGNQYALTVGEKEGLSASLGDDS